MATEPGNATGTPAIDVVSVDRALTTTRSVRRRLDLERPVDHEVVLDCIDVAEQAPSGGNQGSRRWVVVRDPALKRGLAELYLASAGRWMIDAHERIAGTGHPQEKVMASAAHLARHLAEVPVIVVPTIIGVHDGSGRPGLFDSVIQSVWSFCVALRARGLGTAWTTAILSRHDEVAELLGIPEGMTQIAMIPVAWTKGTDFRPAPRRPSREITYVDRFARTWERGPGARPRLADGPGTVVEVDVGAPTEVVWPYVRDIEPGATRAGQLVGAGLEVPCVVDRVEEGRILGWATPDPTNPGARWWFELEPIAGATRLRYRVVLGPGPSDVTTAVERDPDEESHIIARYLDEHRRDGQRIVEAIRLAAEGDAAEAREARRRTGTRPPFA